MTTTSPEYARRVAAAALLGDLYYVAGWRLVNGSALVGFAYATDLRPVEEFILRRQREYADRGEPLHKFEIRVLPDEEPVAAIQREVMRRLL